MDTNTTWETLRDFAEGRIEHINAGSCPDCIEGFGQRDIQCPVCRALDTIAGAAPAAVAGPAREEIAALREEHGITSTGRGIKEFEQVDTFVRAVLQRWGAAPALEAPAAPTSAASNGWRLVPTGRATTAMVLAASHAHALPGASYSDLWTAMLAAAPQAPAAPVAAITDAQVDAYLTTQRRSVEQADRLPMGITPTNAVREACRQGLLAAIGAAPAAPSAYSRSQHDADSRELRRLCQARDEARRERDLARAENAGLQASTGHLSALVDGQHELLEKAKATMTALHGSASPIDESGGDFDARIPASAFARFVDAHAELLHAMAQSPVAAPAAPSVSKREEKLAPPMSPSEYLDHLLAAPAAPSALATQVIENLLQLARIVNTAVEDWGETKEDDSLEVIFHKEEADKLESILEFFDSLPDAPAEEGVIESGPLRAARVLRAMEAPAASVVVPAQGDPAALQQLAELLESGRSLIHTERKEAADALRHQAAAAKAAPPAPSDAQLLSEWDRVSGITKATERRLACMRAVLKRWGSAAPAAPAVDAALNALIADVRALPTLRASEIDGEESDGTPKHWRNRPFVSLRKLELLLRDRVTASSDTALLNFIAAEYLDLLSFGMPTGQGDADVGWRVIQHHMGEPTERVVAEVYKDDPRSAIRAAIARLERDPYCTGALHEEDAAQAAAKGTP